MPRRLFKEFQLFDAKAATGVSEAVRMDEFRHWTLIVAAPLNTSLTFKVQGSGRSGDAPDFSSAQSVTNNWEYIHIYDMEDPVGGLDGDTGVVLNNDTAANNNHHYAINSDHLTWFSLEISSYTD